MFCDKNQAIGLHQKPPTKELPNQTPQNILIWPRLPKFAKKKNND
jgi:hypothetical protein